MVDYEKDRDKGNGRSYSILGIIFLIPFVLFIILMFSRILVPSSWRYSSSLHWVYDFYRSDFTFLLFIYGNLILLILSIIFGIIAEKKGDNKLGMWVSRLGFLFLILDLLLWLASFTVGGL